MKGHGNGTSMKPRTISLAVFFLALVLIRQDQEVGQRPVLPREDEIRLAEAFRLADSVQDRIWANWSEAPFALLLITSEYECLIGHPHATNNFDTLGYDANLHRLVLVRKRLFPTNLLATFPAINSMTTIVVGQSANTNVSSSSAWVVTILHEHFHQYQQSQPDYVDATNALGLSRGDKTGMWMLNYPFPYDSIVVDTAYAAMSRSLLKAINSQQRDQPKQLKVFLTSLERFKLSLSPDDFNYFSFQCWQEGVARYTELRVAELAASRFTPSNAFRSLRDYKPFGEVADSIRSGILNELANPSLANSRRVGFYAFGSGEALLLDKVQPDWKQEYFRTKFYLDRYFSK